jgi:DNA topoisomerase-3
MQVRFFPDELVPRLTSYLLQSVAQSLGGRGIAAGDVARRPPPPGGRRNGGNNDDDDGPPSDGDDGGPPAAPAKRGKGAGAKSTGKTATAKTTKAKAKTETATVKKAPAKRAKKGVAADTDIQPNGGPGSGPGGSAATMVAGGKVVMCGCGERAVARTVVKETANKGMEFWACAKPMGDAGRCGFFVSAFR